MTTATEKNNTTVHKIVCRETLYLYVLLIVLFVLLVVSFWVWLGNKGRSRKYLGSLVSRDPKYIAAHLKVLKERANQNLQVKLTGQQFENLIQEKDEQIKELQIKIKFSEQLLLMKNTQQTSV